MNPEHGEGSGRDERERSPEGKFTVAFETLPSDKHPDRNEDASLALPERGVFAIFDGMGGHRGGAEASTVAREAIIQALEKRTNDRDDVESAKQEITELFRAAHEALLALRRDKYGESDHNSLDEEAEKKFPDTTCTLVRVVPVGEKQHFLVYAHAGDSRLYVDRRDEDILEQATEDDDLVSDFAKDPALRREIRRALDEVTSPKDLEKEFIGLPLRTFFAFRNVISNSLGKDKGPGIGIVPVAAGDRVILTSDGVHDNLTSVDMQNIVGDAESVEEIARELAKRAQERSREKIDHNVRAKPDDMTALVVEVK